jgi:hypothetical protein
MKLTPSSFTGVSLERQQQILEHIKAHPLGSYVFSGAPGVGKTTFMRELQRLSWEAQWKNHAVYAKTGTQFQHDATAAARGERVAGGFVRPQELDAAQGWGIRWSIFLDDLDKISGSEFIRKELFGLSDAVIQERKMTTQLVITTNMRKSEFAKYFGDHICWRVERHCHWVTVERES